jgi:hypothetical protein
MSMKKEAKECNEVMDDDGANFFNGVQLLKK